MYSIRRWLYKPKKNDPSLLAQLFYADEELNLVATELDSFDGRKDPERCTTLVNQLRMCQDHVLNIIHQIMDTVILSERANRDFRVKFPDDVLQENLAGQLWFGAECLAAGSSIMNREVESASMRPLAKAVTKTLDNLRSLLRDQALRDPLNYTEKIREALKQFDQLFSEFELSYVSAMVPVKTMKEYDIQQDVIVLFSEAVQRALRLKLLTQEMIDDYDPALMFTIPRLAIVCGLLIHPEGPLNVDMDPSDISEMFRPFQSLLYKIRDLLWTLNKSELYTLEKVLCSTEDPGIFLNLKKVNFPDDYRPPDRQEFIERFYKDHPGCEQFIKSLHYLHCHRPDLGIRCGSYQSEAQLGNSTSEENIQGTLPDSDSQEDFLAEQTFVAMQENLSITLENVIDSGDQTQDSGVGSDCSISDKSHEHSSAVSHVYVDLKAIQNDIVIMDNLTLAVENMKYSNCENQALQIPVIEIDSDRNCSSEPDSPNSVICCVGETQPEPSKITLIHNILEQCSDSSENTHANSSTDQTSLISSNYNINTSEAINANSSTDQTSLISSAYNMNPGKLKADNIQISSSHVIEKSINFPNSCDKNSMSVETSALKPIRHKSHLCSRHKAKHADSLNHDSLGLREEYTKLRQTEGESQALEIPRLHQLRYSGSISGSSCSSHRSSLCNSDWEPEGYDSSDTSSYNSECHDDEEIALAIQAAEIATRNEVRSRFHNSADLIHRLFVCISGVADQLQTNYASDLRNILKSVFEINCSEPMTNFLDDIQYIQTAEEVHSDSEDLIGNRRSFEEPPPWIPDEQAPHCSTCKIPFTIVRRRHHCRNCGKIFCSRCSINSVPLPRYGHVKPVRVCNCCFMFQVTPFMVDE